MKRVEFKVQVIYTNPPLTCFFKKNRSTVQYRKWSPTANGPQTTNDPRPQVIPKVDPKWSRKKNRNGVDSS